jgi:hypothetical protein
MISPFAPHDWFGPSGTPLHDTPGGGWGARGCWGVLPGGPMISPFPPHDWFGPSGTPLHVGGWGACGGGAAGDWAAGACAAGAVPQVPLCAQAEHTSWPMVSDAGHVGLACDTGVEMISSAKAIAAAAATAATIAFLIFWLSRCQRHSGVGVSVA